MITITEIKFYKNKIYFIYPQIRKMNDDFLLYSLKYNSDDDVLQFEYDKKTYQLDLKCTTELLNYYFIKYKNWTIQCI